MDERLKYKTEYYKTLRGKHRPNILDINHSHIFSDSPHRVMTIKTKINKWDLIKFKMFHTAKETLNKTKRQPTQWEKIFANEATNKGWIPKIYKQHLQLNVKKTNNPTKKWAEDLNRHFSKEDIQMAKKTHKKMLNITDY